MAEFVVNILDFLTNEVIIFIISMLPLIELRGSIPVGLMMDFSPLMVFLLTFPASLIPAPFISLLIKKVFEFLETRSKFFNKLIERIIHRTNRKHREKIDKYGLWGLFIIVAIPLPGTGVWSGSLAAALFDFKFKSALMVIVIGNFIAAIAILLISMGALSFF